MALQVEFEQKIPLWIVDIAHRLQKHHFTTYLVGGALRNIVLGKPIKDFDLATNAEPSDVISIFKYTINTGIKYGTVTVLWKSNKAEVTTLRTESGYADYRHPTTIRFGNGIVQDLSRRDFTINAMAYDILSHRFYDPFKGLRDAKKGVIKTVGRARTRIKEDALRMLRCVRFASQYNLLISHKIIIMCRLFHRQLGGISRERIGVEVHKIVMSDYPSVGMHYLCSSYLVYVLSNDGTLLRDIHQYQTRNKIVPYLFDSYYRLHITNPAERYALFMIALIWYTVQKDYNNTMHVVDAIFRSLINFGIKKSLIHDAHAIVRGYLEIYHDKDRTIRSYSQCIRSIGKKYTKSCYHVISSLPINWLTEINMKLFAWCCDNLTVYSIKDLMITGNDLIKNGIKQGVVIGRILNVLLAMVINNPTINKHHDLLELAKEKRIVQDS